MRRAALLITTAAAAVCAALGCERDPEAPRPAPEPAASEASEASAPRAAPAPGALAAPSEAQAALLARAKTAFLGDDPSSAEPIFAELAASRPVSGAVVTAGLALGDLYANSGRADRARALYASLTRSAASVPEVWLAYGRSLASSDSAGARAALARAVELQPLYAFAHMEIGALLAREGLAEQSARSMLSYERAVYALARELGARETAAARRREIIEAFSLMADDRVTEALVRAARVDALDEVRAAAIRALANSGARAALPDVIAVERGDQSEEVRRAASSARAELEALPVSEDAAAAPARVERDSVQLAPRERAASP